MSFMHAGSWPSAGRDGAGLLQPCARAAGSVRRVCGAAHGCCACFRRGCMLALLALGGGVGRLASCWLAQANGWRRGCCGGVPLTVSVLLRRCPTFVAVNRALAQIEEEAGGFNAMYYGILVRRPPRRDSSRTVEAGLPVAL